MKYLIAYNSNDEVVNIEDAIVTEQYYFKIGDERIELINAFNGDIMTKHWRSKVASADKNLIFHKSCQMYIVSTKTLIYQGTRIIANRVLMEHDASRMISDNFNYIPDLLMLDENDNPICIVEVHYTNKKNDQDIKKIRTFNIPCIELTFEIEHGYKEPTRTQTIFISEEFIQNRERYNSEERLFESRIAEVKRDIKTIRESRRWM